MTRLHRFFIQEKPAGDLVFLDRAQSHHLKKVLRIKKGTSVELFGSEGAIYQGVFESFQKDLAGIRIITQPGSNTTTAPPLLKENINRCNITLACAVPKGKRMDWLVQKVAELGLKRLIPLTTARSEVIAGSKSGGAKFQRWQKIAIEAAKQSGQPLVEIAAGYDFTGILSERKNYDLALIAWPESKVSLSEVLEKNKNARSILYLIGPEGDFTKEEVLQAGQSGFQPVLLPVGSILRVETAAAAMLAMLLYEFNRPTNNELANYE